MEQARQKLAEARAKRRWTLEKAAEELGVSPNTVTAWEHGRAKPYAYNVDRICAVYGLSPEDLVTTASIIIPPQENVGRHIQAFIKQDLTMRLCALASQPYRSHQEIHTAMARILKDYDSMSNHRMNRRKALLRLVTLPFATPTLAAALAGEETPPATLSKDLLVQCAVSIGACWELRKSAEYDDLSLAFEGVSAYLPTLQRIVKAYSQHRQEAAGLVIQCLLLKSILSKHLEGTREAVQYAQQTLSYNKDAKDLSLHLAALASLSLAYSYDHQHVQSLQAIEQAEPLLQQIEQKKLPVSPHAQALAHGMLACVLSRQRQDASMYIEKAEALVSETDTSCPLYVIYGRGDFLLDAGIVQYQQGNSTGAVDILSRLVDPETLTLKIPDAEITRIETMNAMTRATLKAKERNMERAIHFWIAGVQAAKALHSEQRFKEALAAYDIMEYIWPDEKRILELRDLTEHW